MRRRSPRCGRIEAAGRSAHDLDVHGSDDLYTVGKLQGGYTRYFSARRGVTPGLGFSVSAGIVPASLTSAYGGRVNAGVGVFVTLRPAAHTM